MDTQPTPQNPGLAGEQRHEVKPEAAAGIQPENQPSPMPAESAAMQQPSNGPTMGQAGSPVIQGVSPQQVGNVKPVAPAMPAVSGPAVAADVDVIEPEWVDKAEQAIKSSQGDPYVEEEAVEDLQRDYLKKRYGHDVEDANSDTSKPGVS